MTASLSNSDNPRAEAGTTIAGVQTVMKAAFYNQNAATQTDALQHLLPLLHRAAQLVPLPTGTVPLQVSCCSCFAQYTAKCSVTSLAWHKCQQSQSIKASL
jgi:hypothetical protein